ncbi:regulatory protein YycH of two-component signal transduction system YycFG [Cytobacillus firmus]|uniref:Regulatory protein YycH of two-component signal transduction system YycFG n=2 Tax=Cytobacillus TaxID=2675230 RepID=A0A366JJF8_CYTFI|nr:MULTISPECIES: two-component system activity regulator YycH [Cytobacillus]RBP86730.1 regulatory protein YycH of two-component signal transduction system YycFG [Cytobacillus firmus]TDX43509.1 regulatory protein YycH of two-component signal transduction system YycFG [Cytobacillus oceanisediminis]
MTYENIKTIILTILVVTSVLLTWNLWTYQPNFEPIEKANTVKEVTVAEKKDVNQIVKPDTLLFHLGEKQTYGTVSPAEINKIIKEISDWNFADFENITDETGNLPSFVHDEGNAVLVFPDSVPIDLYKSVIKIGDQNLTNFQFDRIVIDTRAVDKKDGNVDFVSMDTLQVYRSHVPVSFIQNFKSQFFNLSEYNPEFKAYFAYKPSDKKTIYLPSQDTKMARYQFLEKKLDSEQYKNALFSDPSVVQKSFQQSEEEYNDTLSLLRVNYDKNTLSYVKPASADSQTFAPGDLLKKSIDFVNAHAGWTDNYQFADIDQLNHKVIFRMYDSSGYPIFSDDPKLSEIRQVWGQNEIYEYSRSNFQLGLSAESPTEVSLSSGTSVMDYLSGLKGFDPDLLENVMLGYKMMLVKEAQTTFIRLEPSWFYRYDGTLKSITLDESGGMNNGLE